MLGFLLGVQVIQITQELVEAVVGRQVFVLVAEVIFTELAGGVTVSLE